MQDLDRSSIELEFEACEATDDDLRRALLHAARELRHAAIELAEQTAATLRAAPPSPASETGRRPFHTTLRRVHASFQEFLDHAPLSPVRDAAVRRFLRIDSILDDLVFRRERLRRSQPTTGRGGAS